MEVVKGGCLYANRNAKNTRGFKAPESMGRSFQIAAISSQADSHNGARATSRRDATRINRQLVFLRRSHRRRSIAIVPIALVPVGVGPIPA